MATWDAAQSQEDFMYKDEVIVVDVNDKIIGHENKYNSHRFVPGQPRGKLHRAFSVFLFDEEGELLLQKRASSKITFPGVWTNTCCSHQLFGYDPSEVDDDAAIASGAVPGAKRAATRKLGHELGMKPSEVPPELFKFLTRLHYYAADTVTHGPAAPWGEHEIDYILVGKVPGKGLQMLPHTEEVEDTRWVSQDELKQMLADPALLWSPWFRIIAERFLLPCWWRDLKATLDTDACVQRDTIHRFDPPTEHVVPLEDSSGGFMTDNARGEKATDAAQAGSRRALRVVLRVSANAVDWRPKLCSCGKQQPLHKLGCCDIDGCRVLLPAPDRSSTVRTRALPFRVNL